MSEGEEPNLEDSEEEVKSLEVGEDLRGRLEDMKPGLERDLDLREKARWFAAAGVALVLGIFVFSGGLELAPRQGEDTREVNLTDYQESYVDCPARYLETCTKMSKIPTEPVNFWKKEEDRLYLKLGDGRAIISTLPSSTSPGEFVTFMSAAEVSAAEGGEA